MTKYIMKDVITNPEDPRLKDAIGKRVYCEDEVSKLLKNANSDYFVETLTQIKDVDFEPFTTKDKYGDPSDWNCIILKKEEPKPKYVPFENIEEFLEACRRVEINWLEANDHYLSKRGIWLKDKEVDAYCMVTEIWDMGIVIGNKNITIGETTVFNDITSWDELLAGYTFLDGTPCGKKIS